MLNYLKSKILLWSRLRHFGDNQILRSSYFWIAFVPLVAKILRYVNSVNIEFYKQIIKLDLELPFSWQLFFWGALSTSIANIIYAINCPNFIKKFDDYSGFEKSGRSDQQLLNEFAIVFSERYYQKGEKSAETTFFDFKDQFCDNHYQTDKDAFEESSYDTVQYIPKLRIKKDSLKDAFWFFYNYLDSLDQLCRAICTILYYAGISCFLLVIVQNIWFVISNSFSK
jgi:hypothetical protein